MAITVLKYVNLHKNSDHELVVMDLSITNLGTMPVIIQGETFNTGEAFQAGYASIPYKFNFEDLVFRGNNTRENNALIRWKPVPKELLTDSENC